jgi:hypothetical protein
MVSRTFLKPTHSLKKWVRGDIYLKGSEAYSVFCQMGTWGSSCEGK